MADEGEIIDWLFEGTRWWLSQFGGYEALAPTHILLPTDEYFPVTPGAAGHELAEDLFSFAVHHARLEQWNLVLEYDDDPNPLDLMRGLPHAMTGGVSGGEVEGDEQIPEGEPLPVPYGNAQLDDPLALMATIARGLSHYVIEGANEPFPGEADDDGGHRRATYVDLGAILLGFGVFTANASFRFHQATEGLMATWGYARSGALSQQEQGMAVGFMVSLLDAPWRKIAKHLDPNPRRDLKRAMKRLKKRRGDLDALRAVRPVGKGPYR